MSAKGRCSKLTPLHSAKSKNVPYYGDEFGAIEAGEDSWGFRVRPASLLEHIEGELALAVREQVAVSLLFVVGVLLGVMVFRKPSQRALLDGMFLLKVLAAVPLLMLGALIDFVSGITAPLFLMSLAAGFVVCILFRHLLRWVGNLDQAGHSVPRASRPPFLAAHETGRSLPRLEGGSHLGEVSKTTLLGHKMWRPSSGPRLRGNGPCRGI